MKTARIIGIGLGALVVLVVIVTALALSSSVQTWAARRALASRSDMSGSLGSLSAGLQRVEVRALKVESQGVVLVLPTLDADLPVVSAGLSERVLITRLIAKGWTLDLRNAKSVAALRLPNRVGERAETNLAEGGARDFSLISSAVAADSVGSSVAPAFQGVFNQLQLPVDLSLDGVELEGEVLLPDNAGYGMNRLQVSIRGGGMGAGREGSFRITLAGVTADAGTLNVETLLTAAMDSPRTFGRLGAVTDAMAKGPQFPEGAALKLNGMAVRSPVGETYELLVVGREKPVADLKAELVSATPRISGTWKLDLHDTDLAPFSLGQALPTFAATGEGRFETGATFSEIHASGRLEASGSRFEVVRPELSAVGAMSLTADFDVLQHGDSLRIERLDATASGPSPVGSVQALQPFEFNLGTGELHVADPSKDLLGIVLKGLPLAWAAPFTGELELTGGDVRGEFVASARDGGLALRARTPLTMTGVSLKSAGAPMLDAIDLTLNASADYTPLGWQAQVVELTLRSLNRTLFSLDAKAGRLVGDHQAIKATGHWSADLAGWTTQPIASGQLELASGLAQGDFSASIDGTSAVEAKVGLSNLVAKTQEALPAVHAELRADLTPAGLLTFHAPVLFEQAGRKSDLLFAGTLVRRSDGGTIEARISSERIVAEDVQLLALLLTDSPSTPPDRTGIPDSEPFWGQLDGQVTLALKKLVYGGSFEVSNVGGTLRLDPTALTLDNVRAIFGPESDLKVAGGIKFSAGAVQPYALAADVMVTNFDTKPAFEALDPAKLPTLEARVNMNGRVAGNGANLAELTQRSQGDVQVTAKSGLFRALSADMSEKVQKTQSTVAALGGLLGAVTGKKEYADYANKTQILSDIAKALSEIPFDQLNVTATRDSDLSMVLKDFTLISPEVRLTGAGSIRHTEGVALLAQPLALQLSLGARGQLADLLKRAGLIEATEDTLGYAAFSVPIKIGGSLAKTDTSELRNALLNSALERSGLLEGLLGK